MRMILKKNVILEGVFGSECIDTAGERLLVNGADISHLIGGFVNTEHINPTDLEKEKDSDFKGFQSIVGRVVDAKKIYSEQDCKTDKEKKAFKTLNCPLIYGKVEIFDGPDAHDNAKAAASLARMLHNTNTKLGLSVEGSTIKRNGQVLEKTIIRGLALTLKPANRTAKVDLVQDSTTPQVAKSQKNEALVGGMEPLYKSIDMQYIHCVPEMQDFGLFEAFNKLKKALEAGSSTGAPASLTQGAALQKENHLHKLVKFFGKKPKKDDILKALPNLKEEDAEAISKAIKDHSYNEFSEIAEEFYKKIK